MTTQTENYLILKPIAERVNRVADKITEEDIRYIIIGLLQQKVSEAFNFDAVNDIINDCIENHKDEIAHAAMDSLAKRLELPNGYRWW